MKENEICLSTSYSKNILYSLEKFYGLNDLNENNFSCQEKRW